jgi:hypothetical protein
MRGPGVWCWTCVSGLARAGDTRLPFLWPEWYASSPWYPVLPKSRSHLRPRTASVTSEGWWRRDGGPVSAEEVQKALSSWSKNVQEPSEAWWVGFESFVSEKSVESFQDREVSSLMCSMAILGAPIGCHRVLDAFVRQACEFLSRDDWIPLDTLKQLKRGVVLLRGTSFAIPHLSWLAALIEDRLSGRERPTRQTFSSLHRRVFEALVSCGLSCEVEFSETGGLSLDLVVWPMTTEALPWVIEVDGPQHFLDQDPSRPNGETLARRRLITSRSETWGGICPVTWLDLSEATVPLVDILVSRASGVGCDLGTLRFPSVNDPKAPAPQEEAWSQCLRVARSSSLEDLKSALRFDGDGLDLMHTAQMLHRLSELNRVGMISSFEASEFCAEVLQKAVWTAASVEAYVLAAEALQGLREPALYAKVVGRMTEVTLEQLRSSRNIPAIVKSAELCAQAGLKATGFGERILLRLLGDVSSLGPGVSGRLMDSVSHVVGSPGTVADLVEVYVLGFREQIHRFRAQDLVGLVTGLRRLRFVFDERLIDDWLFYHPDDWRSLSVTQASVLLFRTDLQGHPRPYKDLSTSVRTALRGKKSLLKVIRSLIRQDVRPGTGFLGLLKAELIRRGKSESPEKLKVVLALVQDMQE